MNNANFASKLILISCILPSVIVLTAGYLYEQVVISEIFKYWLFAILLVFLVFYLLYIEIRDRNAGGNNNDR